jgi:cytochrome c553
MLGNPAMLRWMMALSVLCSAGCAAAAPTEQSRDASVAVSEPDFSERRPVLCQRTDRSDAVRDLFCTQAAPRITDLHALHQALGLQDNEQARAVLLSHSTALSGDLISELNPRAIFGTRALLVAFSRGIQQVELAALDHQIEDQYNFYLLHFRQTCNLAADGCSPGDLYTPTIELDWQSLALEDDEDLKNTPSDCRQCHQRARPQAILLMREFYSPWTHLFGEDVPEPQNYPEPTGGTLLRDYRRAKGDETYAGLSNDVLNNTIGISLQRMVPQQPLVFRGSQIIGERWPWKDGQYAATPHRSPTWDGSFAAFRRGEQLALPFYAPRASDPQKRAALTQAYQRYRTGELEAAQLPDLADIFPDDPRTRAEIGLQTEPGITPAETLIEACGTCHNDVLDQTITRARFNIALSKQSRDELQHAVDRIKLPRDAPGAMPPPGQRQIDPQSVAMLIDYLESDQRSREDDTLLDTAAELGMSKEAYLPPN